MSLRKTVKEDDPVKEEVAEGFKKGKKVLAPKVKCLEPDNTVKGSGSKTVESKSDSKFFKDKKSRRKGDVKIETTEKLLEVKEIKTDVDTIKDVSVVEENKESDLQLECEKSLESDVKLGDSEKLEDSELKTEEDVIVVAAKGDEKDKDDSDKGKRPVIPGKSVVQEAAVANVFEYGRRVHQGHRDVKETFAEDAICFVLNLYKCDLPKNPRNYAYELSDIKFTDLMKTMVKDLLREKEVRMTERFFETVPEPEILITEFWCTLEKLREKYFGKDPHYTTHQHFIEFLARLGHFTALGAYLLGEDVKTQAILFLTGTLTCLGFSFKTFNDLNSWIKVGKKLEGNARARVQQAFIRPLDEPDDMHPMELNWHLSYGERRAEIQKQRHKFMKRKESVDFDRDSKRPIQSPSPSKKRAAKTQVAYKDGFKVPMSPTKKLASKTRHVKSVTPEKLALTSSKDYPMDLSSIPSTPSVISHSKRSPIARTYKRVSPSKRPYDLSDKLFKHSPTLTETPKTPFKPFDFSRAILNADWTVTSQHTAKDFSIRSSSYTDTCDWSYAGLSSGLYTKSYALSTKSSANVRKRQPSCTITNPAQARPIGEEISESSTIDVIQESSKVLTPDDNVVQESASENIALDLSLSLDGGIVVQDSQSSSSPDDSVKLQDSSSSSPDDENKQENPASMQP